MSLDDALTEAVRAAVRAEVEPLRQEIARLREEAEQLVDAEAAARHIGVPKRTLLRWACTGRVPAARTAGGAYRFRLSELAPSNDQVADVAFRARAGRR